MTSPPSIPEVWSRELAVLLWSLADMISADASKLDAIARLVRGGEGDGCALRAESIEIRAIADRLYSAKVRVL